MTSLHMPRRDDGWEDRLKALEKMGRGRRRGLPDWVDGDDLVQDTLTSVVEAKDSMNVNWAMSGARRRYRRAIREQDRCECSVEAAEKRGLLPPDRGLGPLDRALRRDMLRSMVRAAIGVRRSLRRGTVLLRFLRGETATEIADTYGVAVSSVAAMLRRVVRR